MAQASHNEHLAKLASQVAQVPTEPGCYLWKNASGDVLYVGKAKNLARVCVSMCSYPMSGRWCRVLWLLQTHLIMWLWVQNMKHLYWNAILLRNIVRHLTVRSQG